MRAFLYQVAIPASWWDAQPSAGFELGLMVREALDIERRLPKGVDKGRDRRRYSACCQSIENFARQHFTLIKDHATFTLVLAQSGFPAARVDASYLNFLEHWLATNPTVPREARLATTFFPPTLLTTHSVAFEAALRASAHTVPPSVPQRLEFLRWAREAGCGVIEFADIYTPDTEMETVLHAEVRAQHIASPKLAVRPASDITPSAEQLPTPRPESEESVMQREIATALAQQHGVNFSNYHHPTIAMVLRQHAYQKDGQVPVMLTVFYGDNSQSRPFPLFHLPFEVNRLRAVESAPSLRVALLSTRHPEMDGEVDLAWLLNRGASKLRESFADTDEWCYQKSLALFSSLPTDRLTVIELYQTGLETAVVGFYRALVEVLRGGAARVAVRPRIYRGPGVYQPGQWWV
jgi:hypothetical protein